MEGAECEGGMERGREGWREIISYSVCKVKLLQRRDD